MTDQPRSEIMDHVDRQLVLRQITQSVPGMITVVVPFKLTEGTTLEGMTLVREGDTIILRIPIGGKA